MTRHTFDTVVIGGGLHGLSAALHLAREGQSVAVVEKSWSGRHASGATAAGVRTLGRNPAEIPLALQSMDIWHAIADLVDDDCGFHADGQMRVAETEAELDILKARLGRMQEMGYSHEVLINANTLRDLVPALSHHCLGALYVERDGAADPHRTLAAFQRTAERHGAEIFEGEGVEAIGRQGSGWRVQTTSRTFESAAVVNAAGAWAGEIARLIGDVIPLGTKASMMIVTERLDTFVRPVVGAVGRQLSFKQTDRGTLVIGGGIQGTYDLWAGSTTLDFMALAESTRAASTLFPAVGNVMITRCWAGLEAKTADMLPVIAASPEHAGAFHVFGFSGHGFELVPAAGAAVADLVLRGRTDRPIAPFTPERLMTAGETP